MLALLQGAESRAVRKRRPADDGAVESKGESDVESGGAGRVLSEKAPVTSPRAAWSIGRQGAIAHALGQARGPECAGRAVFSRYVRRHILRAPQKSALTVAVALGFILVG